LYIGFKKLRNAVFQISNSYVLPIIPWTYFALQPMEQQINNSPLVNIDPNIVLRAPGADFTPSSNMLEEFPYIQDDFFKRPLEENDRRRFLFDCPKNTLRNYDPPKLNKVQLNSPHKQFDASLSTIQYRLSGITRPMDWFAYQLLHANWDPATLKQQARDFTYAVHELISDLASHITTLRTDNMFRGLPNGLEPPAPSTEKFLIDTQDMLDHIKLQQSVQNATQKQRNKRNNGPRSKRSSIIIVMKHILVVLDLIQVLVTPLTTNPQTTMVNHPLILVIILTNRRVFSQDGTNKKGFRSGGWKASLFFFILVFLTRFFRTSMAPPSSPSRLQHPTHLSATASFLQSKSIRYRQLAHHPNDRSRDSEASLQTGNRTSSKPPSANRLPFQSFRHSQEGWWAQTSTQPETSQSIFTNPTLQNGNYDNYHQFTTTRRLFDLDRLKRRLPSYSHTQTISSPAAIPMETTNISISSPTVWPEPFAFNLYESTQTGSQVGSPQRHPYYCLFRRYADYGENIPTDTGLYPAGMQENDRIRMASQFFQIVSNSLSVHHSPRNEYQFSNNGYFGTRQENTVNTSHGLFPFKANDSQLDTPSQVYWHHHGHTNGECSSAISDSSSFDTIKPVSTSIDLGYYCSNAERAFMVDHRAEEMEWSTSDIDATNYANIYGRLRHGLRLCLGQQFLSRHLVTHRTTITHQPKGAFGNPKSVPIYSYSSKPSHTVVYRQHFSDRIHQTLWRNKILLAEPDSSRYLEVLLSELHSTLDTIRPIQAQPSRRTISCHSESD
jgi:hypothetical protein